MAHRNPDTGLLESDEPDIHKRFWSKVSVDGPVLADELGPCWPWLESLDTYGYAQFWLDGHSKVMAHRFAYELLFGPIQSGLEISHLCRNRACQNPSHMEAVTPRENTLRGISITALHSAKTHCLRGHPFDAVNTYIPPHGGRYCRICRTDWHRQHGASTGR
jgi:hypothetical protein